MKRTTHCSGMELHFNYLSYISCFQAICGFYIITQKGCWIYLYEKKEKKTFLRQDEQVRVKCLKHNSEV